MKSILLNYAKKCVEKDYFEGVVYDRNENMSVVKKDGGYIPFIEDDSVKMSVMTKTEVARERDDALSMILISKN